MAGTELNDSIKSPFPERRVPDVYVQAGWLCTTPIDPYYQEMGIGFTLTDGCQVRLRLPREQALQLSQSIADYCGGDLTEVHSLMSSGMPRSPVSTPDE